MRYIMNLFKREKKFDYQSDYLRLTFDLETLEYCYFFQSDKAPLPYEKLNRRTKKQLDDANRKLRENKELLETEIQKAKERERFDFLNSHGLIGGGFEVLGVSKGTMSPEMNEFLTKLTTTKNLTLGIHRTGYSDMECIEDILANGLTLTGHSSSGAFSQARLSNNVSFYPDNKTIIKELMYASEYKNSLGSILIAIPDSDLDQDIYVTKEDESGNITKALNPKYILGFVPTDKNYHIHTIMSLDELRRQKNSMELTQDQDFSPFQYEMGNEQAEEIQAKRR